MDNIPSQKTLRKFFWAVSVLLGLALGMWISLYFVTEMEKLREYAIVFRYWYGVYLASKFICILLAFCWVFLIVARIIVAILGDKTQKTQEPQVNITERHHASFGDLSDFD